MGSALPACTGTLPRGDASAGLGFGKPLPASSLLGVTCRDRAPSPVSSLLEGTHGGERGRRARRGGTARGTAPCRCRGSTHPQPALSLSPPPGQRRPEPVHPQPLHPPAGEAHQADHQQVGGTGRARALRRVPSPLGLSSALCVRRQALSLLFDTFHNEVDAFLAAEVSVQGLRCLGEAPGGTGTALPFSSPPWKEAGFGTAWLRRPSPRAQGAGFSW